MSLPFTSVVSYHTNPMTCGVAKFSAQLAERLGVPFVGFDGEKGDFPLYSVKASEIPEWTRFEAPPRYGVFAHDDVGDLAVAADVIFYADPSLGSPGLWCPSLITPRKRPIKLFSFGMAHKIQADKYRRVRELLDAAGLPFHLRLSVGLHEGTDLADATKHFDALKEIMGPEHVTILGILSDDAVSEELSNCDYVLAFFEKGVRGNNTTVHAALSHGRAVVTNHDFETPSGFAFATFHLDELTTWPTNVVYATANLHDVGLARGPDYYSWDNLIREMEALCANSVSRTA